MPGRIIRALTQLVTPGDAAVMAVPIRPELRKRSSRWQAVRDKWIKLNSRCAVCNGWRNLEVHHVLPVHLFPEHELAVNNLVTICDGPGQHHFWFGHLGDWHAYNPDVLADAMAFKVKVSERRYGVADHGLGDA